MTIAADRAESPPTTRAATAGELYTARERRRLILALGALIALGPFSIDMYLPALPKIALDLHTTESAIQLTLTGTLLGLGFGQLLVGPLSDAVGRRKPLIIGSIVHVVASLLCLVAPNVVLLDIARVLQGFGASAGAVLAVAVARDLFNGRAAATLLSRLMLLLGVSPVLAPTIGGELLRWTHWRGVFAMLALLGLLTMILTALTLPETLPVDRRQPLKLRSTLRTYGGLLSNATFMGLVVVAGLAMTGVFGYVSGASFVFQQQYGMTQQQFGLFFGLSAIWLIGATQLNARLLRRFEPHQVLVVAGILATVSGGVLFAAAATGFGGLPGLVGPLWAVLFFSGLMMPNAPAVALSQHGESAGTAAALLGAMQFGIGAIASPLVGVFGNNAPAMAGVMASGVLLATIVLVTVARPWRLEVPRDADVVVVH
ncbi:multidrug effflux MFS transporter [Pseudonocardia spinosispora]|uniref:multidrug effflux MFS transporter n=1 Tax=Pseudonocardia spinosispora TaxID=103441 RepID=UPI000423686C|nr:multidrug effflux MFS transporter [Pseudonocardia spinosispora]